MMKYDVKEKREASPHAVSFKGQKTLTQQQFKKQCCIHNIIKKAREGGEITHINKGVSRYMDGTQINDFREAMQKMTTAKNEFDSLPVAVRQRFNYDPLTFLEFALNPENGQEMVKLGLAVPRELPKTEPSSEAPPQADA